MDIRYWIGIVEDNVDSEMRGRVKVRILGVHTNITTKTGNSTGIGLPKEDLPWALPLMPLIYGGVPQSTVPPPMVHPGAWVFGISLDGDAYQTLFILGIVSLRFSDMAKGDGSTLLDTTQQEIQETSDNTSVECFNNYYTASINAEKELNGTASSTGGDRMASALKEVQSDYPEKYSKFLETSGLEIASLDNLDETSKNVLGRMLYQNMTDKYSDYFVASLAYYKGVDYTEQKLKLYGNPSDGSISNEEFIQRLKDTKDSGDINVANYLEKVVAKIDSEMNTKCNTSRPAVVSSDGCVLPTMLVADNCGNVVTSRYGKVRYIENSATYGKPHAGTDFHAPMNSVIVSCKSGKVTMVGGDYNAVYIQQDDGYTLKYLHLNTTSVAVGDLVKSGQQIGLAGGWGPNGSQSFASHLHLGVSDSSGATVNPETYLSSNGLSFTYQG